jgi:hypothetical protein
MDAPKPIINLSDEQKKRILEMWNSNPPDNPPSLDELVFVAFKQAFDTRSREGRAVREFLASRQLNASKSSVYKPKGLIDLKDDQQQYISNNCSTMSAVEMARTIFNNPSLVNLSRETRSVQAYLKTLDNKIVFGAGINEEVSEEYKPPNAPDRCVARINKYIHEQLDFKNLTGKQKKDVQTLMGYLHTYRFLHCIKSYDRVQERELFESSFVRYTYDKNDLTQEEVDQFIGLCTEIVIASKILRRIEGLQRILDEYLASDDDQKKNLSMSLVEVIGKMTTEYHQCVNRQNKALEELKVKRSDRLSKAIKDNASILNLVNEWKDEEKRMEMLRLGEKRKEIVNNEIDRLASLDEIKARIMGITRDEILNG